MQKTNFGNLGNIQNIKSKRLRLRAAKSVYNLVMRQGILREQLLSFAKLACAQAQDRNCHPWLCHCYSHRMLLPLLSLLLLLVLCCHWWSLFSFVLFFFLLLLLLLLLLFLLLLLLLLLFLSSSRALSRCPTPSFSPPKFPNPIPTEKKSGEVDGECEVCQ